MKNIYVRSIIMHKILDSNSALVHSAAFSLNNKGIILAGRPGVFKTSILMDAIRKFNANYLGEENCIVSNKKVFPFPLNVDSIYYKIKKYVSEDPSGKFQKLKLGFYLMKMKSKSSKLKIAEPTDIDSIFFLVKGDSFKISILSIDEIIPELIENEVSELSIPPTHSLSGIKYNYFKG